MKAQNFDSLNNLIDQLKKVLIGRIKKENLPIKIQ
jgi:hypothetical protein